MGVVVARLSELLAGIVGVAVMIGAHVSHANQSAEPDAGKSVAGEGEIQEIVVTAERRKERLQDVPLSVSVITAADAVKMGNSTNLSLSTQVPGLTTSPQLTGATLYLRGVGTNTAPGNENPVATYVDDVYITGFSSTIVPFNNVAQIEVLKGPQGTLFGRNATGGVIHVVTKDPSATPSLDVQVGYANYNTYSTSLYGTTGLGSNLAVDFAYLSSAQLNGYGHDLSTGQPIFLGRDYGLRSKLKWTPGEKTAVTLAVDHYWTNYDTGSNSNVPPGTLGVGGATYAGMYNSQTVDLFTGGGANAEEGHVDAVALTVQHEFDWATLKSITARRQSIETGTYDQANGPASVVNLGWNEKVEYYTEEVHLSSPERLEMAGHAVHWLAGLFAYKNNDGVRPFALAGPVIGGLTSYAATSVSYTRSGAVFFDATYALASTTNLTLGVRETDDRIKNIGDLSLGLPAGGTTRTPAPEQHENASKLTYRAILDHKFTDDLMVYGSAARGFKSGGFSLFAEGTPPVKPETLDAYALGLKSDWLRHRLQANLEAYDYDYKNQQVSVYISGGAALVNAAASRIYGFDASLVAAATSDLTFHVNFGYLHGRYSSFANAPIYLQAPATCLPTPTRLPGPLTPGNVACAFDAAGYPTVRSPTYSGNVSADYVI
ncbi:MAG: iron complex outerrane recepter protein, partial [Gammaproteobacteria bacterium]|nr:iron complex outerrane recepter protein [Gammaproteobacteria bacterium]